MNSRAVTALAAVVLVSSAVLPALAGSAVAGAGDVDRETAGYTVEELSETVSNADTPESVLWSSDNEQMWVRHLPVGLGVGDSVSEFGRYVEPRTLVRRDAVYLGSTRSRAAEPKEVTVNLVTWRQGTEQRTGPNSTTRAVTVPQNVTERSVDVTLGGGYDRTEIPLPESFDERKRVTMWVEGAESSLRWTFQMKTSKATQAISISSLGGAISFSIWNVGIWIVLTAGGLVIAASWAIKKAGRGPKWGTLEYAFVAFGFLFFGGFLAYNGIMNTLARRPQLIGVAGGVLIGGLGLRALSSPGTEALFLQPTHKTKQVNADGSGDWWFANQVHTVVERESDGKEVIPRPGWIPFIAALWPGSDARPVMEFEGRPERQLDSPPEEDDLFPKDDASVLDRIRTRITGDVDEGDEYETIYLIDPMADDVITYEEEGFEFSLPTLVEWPESDDEGTWVKGYPLPSVAAGRILGGLAVLVVSFVGLRAATASSSLAMLGTTLVLLALVVKPVEGHASVQLAPAQFDGVLSNVLSTVEGWTELADADHFRSKYHEETAKRRVDRQEQAQRDSRSVFREVIDGMAPPVEEQQDQSQTDTSPSTGVDDD